MIEAITKFIYLGETKVKNENVDIFIEAIRELEVDGHNELNYSKSNAVVENESEFINLEQTDETVNIVYEETKS